PLAVPGRLVEPDRRGARVPGERTAAPRKGGAARGVPRGREGHREAVPRALSTAALRTRRPREARAAHGGAAAPGGDRGRRGDLSAAAQGASVLQAAPHAVRADHPAFSLVRPARALAVAEPLAAARRTAHERAR